MDEKKPVKKLVTKDDIAVKKHSKFKEAMISDDTKKIGSYIAFDVLIPAAKKAISDIVTNGIDMILYGETKAKRTTSSNSISYRSYFNRDRDDRRSDRFSGSETKRTRQTYEDVTFRTRAKAEEILEEMDNVIDEYKVVSVADLYEMLDLDFEYTDNKYGWTSMEGACVRSTRDGFVLDLPRAKHID